MSSAQIYYNVFLYLLQLQLRSVQNYHTEHKIKYTGHPYPLYIYAHKHVYMHTHIYKNILTQPCIYIHMYLYCICHCKLLHLKTQEQSEVQQEQFV